MASSGNEYRHLTLIEAAQLGKQSERELIAAWLRGAHFRGICLQHAADLIESGEFLTMFLDGKRTQND